MMHLRARDGCGVSGTSMASYGVCECGRSGVGLRIFGLTFLNGSIWICFLQGGRYHSWLNLSGKTVLP
jgi:hypothetical protein